MRVVVAVFVLCQALAVVAGQITLRWSPSASASAAGYAVYVGDAPGAYQRRVDVGTATTATLTNLAGGARHYMVVKSYDAANVEGGPSPEVSYLMPGPVLLAGTPASGLQVRFVGETNKTCQIQVSTNLVNWTTIQSIRPLTNDWVSWADANSGAFRQRFYRVLSSP